MIYNRKTFFPFIAESLISRFSIQGELGVSANWTQYTSRSSSKEVEFEYRVMCQPSYYGSGCETLCRERDDNFGHIACSASGQKICLSGWQGEYCTERKFFSFYLRLMINSFVVFVYYFISPFAIRTMERKATRKQSLEFEYQSFQIFHSRAQSFRFGCTRKIDNLIPSRRRSLHVSRRDTINLSTQIPSHFALVEWSSRCRINDGTKLCKKNAFLNEKCKSLEWTGREIACICNADGKFFPPSTKSLFKSKKKKMCNR